MAATSYVLMVALAGLFAVMSFWVGVALAAVIALVVAYRYEIRWVADWTAGRRPRPVPTHARHLRTTKRG